jgi:hypothetical protein
MHTNQTTEKIQRPTRYAQQAQGMPSKALRKAQEAQERGRQWERTDKRAETPAGGYWLQ